MPAGQIGIPRKKSFYLRQIGCGCTPIGENVGKEIPAKLLKRWSGRRGSNPRLPAWEAGIRERDSQRNSIAGKNSSTHHLRRIWNALPVSNHANSQEKFELRRCQCPARFDSPCAGVPWRENQLNSGFRAGKPMDVIGGRPCTIYVQSTPCLISFGGVRCDVISVTYGELGVVRSSSPLFRTSYQTVQ